MQMGKTARAVIIVLVAVMTALLIQKTHEAGLLDREERAIVMMVWGIGVLAAVLAPLWGTWCSWSLFCVFLMYVLSQLYVREDLHYIHVVLFWGIGMLWLSYTLRTAWNEFFNRR